MRTLDTNVASAASSAALAVFPSDTSLKSVRWKCLLYRVNFCVRVGRAVRPQYWI